MQSTAHVCLEDRNIDTVPSASASHFHIARCLIEKDGSEGQPIVEHLEEAFCKKEARPSIVVLHGMGGAGKTQLAYRYTRHFRESSIKYAGLIWVDASSPQAATQDFWKVAQELHCTGTGLEAVAFVHQWLKDQDQPWLLVMDNACSENFEKFGDYVPQDCDGRVLITTRDMSVNEWGHVVEVGRMSVREGVELLIKRVWEGKEKELASAPTGMKAQELQEAVQVVKSLGGLPLAIDLAGSYIKTTGLTSIKSYLEILESQDTKNILKVLTHMPGSRWSYDKSLVGAFQASIDELRENHPESFELMGIFSMMNGASIHEQLLQSATEHTDDSMFVVENSIFPKEATSQYLPLFTNAAGNFDAERLHSVFEPIARLCLMTCGRADHDLHTYRASGILKKSARGIYSLHSVIQTFLRAKIDLDTQKKFAEGAMQLLTQVDLRFLRINERNSCHLFSLFGLNDETDPDDNCHDEDRNLLADVELAKGDLLPHFLESYSQCSRLFTNDELPGAKGHLMAGDHFGFIFCRLGYSSKAIEVYKRISEFSCGPAATIYCDSLGIPLDDLIKMMLYTESCLTKAYLLEKDWERACMQIGQLDAQIMHLTQADYFYEPESWLFVINMIFAIHGYSIFSHGNISEEDLQLNGIDIKFTETLKYMLAKLGNDLVIARNILLDLKCLDERSKRAIQCVEVWAEFIQGVPSEPGILDNMYSHLPKMFHLTGLVQLEGIQTATTIAEDAQFDAILSRRAGMLGLSSSGFESGSDKGSELGDSTGS